jgi:predicted class III extradiol MEMO1 family dioxygenase
MNDDGIRRIYEVSTFLEGIDEGDGRALPYIVCVDDTSRKVLSIVRNWEESDEKLERMHWIVEWPFIPWTGAYPIGFMHMIGSLSGAATGALRALLDSAHVNNMPTAAMLKGSGTSGQSKQLRATETTEIDGGIGADDVRKRVLPVTYNPPSEVLFRLLEFLVQSGESMVRVALDRLAQDNPNMPVGTMYAAIEQGLNVVGAIIGRYYFSMERNLAVLHRINKMYITDEEIRDATGTLLARRADFQGPLDCIPVADPSTPSDAHRHAKIQAVTSRAAQVPQLYNMHNVEKLFLKKMLNMPDEEIDELLTPVPTPQRMNAVNENAAATLGRPISAFPEQDQMAHIHTHVGYMESPFFGQLISIAPKFLPIMVQHLTEHLSLWYVTSVFEKAKEALQGRDPSEFMKIKDQQVAAEFDKTLAMVSADVLSEDTKALTKLPPIIQKAAQMVQQYQQASQPMDPAQVMHEKNQMTAQDNQQKNSLKTQELQQRKEAANMTLIQGQKKIQADLGREQMRAQTQVELSHADNLSEAARLQLKEQANNRRTEQTNAAKLQANRDDNMTALSIAKAEIENQEPTDLSTGAGINPGTNQ